MKRSRKVMALSALLAVTAWANVQVMACCWFAGAKVHASSPSQTTVAGEVTDHSCCPKGASTHEDASQSHAANGHVAHGANGANGVALSPSHAAHSENTGMCCGHDTSPVEITSSTSSFSTVTFLPTVLNALSVLHAEDAHTLPMHSASLDLPIDAGPPRFLSLQRILI